MEWFDGGHARYRSERFASRVVRSAARLLASHRSTQILQDQTVTLIQRMSLLQEQVALSTV
jgi:hypothetical protein